MPLNLFEKICLSHNMEKDGMLDILHTVVPPPVEGRGIASALVRHAFDYALRQGLKPEATCSYARTWLARHPEY